MTYKNIKNLYKGLMYTLKICELFAIFAMVVVKIEFFIKYEERKFLLNLIVNI